MIDHLNQFLTPTLVPSRSRGPSSEPQPEPSREPQPGPSTDPQPRPDGNVSFEFELVERAFHGRLLRAALRSGSSSRQRCSGPQAVQLLHHQSLITILLFFFFFIKLFSIYMYHLF